MSVTAMMSGARLAYVVRPIEGEVTREVSYWNNKKKAIEKRPQKQPAGFMAYFPRGHALRFKTVEELKHYGLDQEPMIVNLDGIHDPKSPAGRLLRAQDDKTRRSAFVDLENQVIALATAKTGSVLMPEQVERAA